MSTPNNSPKKPSLNLRNTNGEQPSATEPMTDKERLKLLDESLEAAGFKFVGAKGASQYVGSEPKGNIRFSNSTKKPKTASPSTKK